MKARMRIFGDDVEFCKWMREKSTTGELPAHSTTCGFVATDVDLMIHAYMQSVDGCGSRQVQAMMHLEIKTRNGEPSASQLDTLWKANQFSGTKHGACNCDCLRHFGVAVLSLSNTTPEDSATMRWGRFKKSECFRRMDWRAITLSQLFELMRFERHPDNFAKEPFRRHHKTTEIVKVEVTQLGFDVDNHVVHRS